MRRGLFREALAEESRRLLALRYYHNRILSLGKAARLAGMSRWAFMDFLSDNDVPVIDLSDEELEAELAAVDEPKSRVGPLIVVSHATPLIPLSKLDPLGPPRDLFGPIHIRQAVYDEAVIEAPDQPGAVDIHPAERIHVHTTTNTAKTNYLQPPTCQPANPLISQLYPNGIPNIPP